MAPPRTQISRQQKEVSGNSATGTVQKVRLGYCFTPYQRLWLYNGAPLVAFYDTLGIRRTYSRLKPLASSRGNIKRRGVSNAWRPASYPGWGIHCSATDNRGQTIIRGWTAAPTTFPTTPSSLVTSDSGTTQQVTDITTVLTTDSTADSARNETVR